MCYCRCFDCVKSLFIEEHFNTGTLKKNQEVKGRYVPITCIGMLFAQVGSRWACLPYKSNVPSVVLIGN